MAMAMIFILIAGPLFLFVWGWRYGSKAAHKKFVENEKYGMEVYREALIELQARRSSFFEKHQTDWHQANQWVEAEAPDFVKRALKTVLLTLEETQVQNELLIREVDELRGETDGKSNFH